MVRQNKRAMTTRSMLDEVFLNSIHQEEEDQAEKRMKRRLWCSVSSSLSSTHDAMLKLLEEPVEQSQHLSNT
jgi:hypothetical protein